MNPNRKPDLNKVYREGHGSGAQEPLFLAVSLQGHAAETFPVPGVPNQLCKRQQTWSKQGDERHRQQGRCSCAPAVFLAGAATVVSFLVWYG